MKKIFLLPLLAFFALGFSACEDDEETPELKNIVEIAQSDANFSILVEAVVRAGLADELSGDGPLTVFAPTNAAFSDLLSELGASSLDDISDATLTAVLLYHVVGAKVNAGDLTDEQVVTTLQGGTFTVDLTGGAKIVDGNVRVANITATDIEASNGVVHVLDKVILPAP